MQPPLNSNIIQVKFRFEPTERKKSVTDYLMNYNASMDLVRQLEKYYHSRGFKKVKVWLEKDTLESGRHLYSIRSNVTFRVPQ